jgi:ribosomal protein S18 acetylase RimI-like enzyme
MANFTLRPLTAEDIPECAKIAGQAFETDRQTQFKAACKANPYNHEDGMRGGLEYWVESTRNGTRNYDMSVCIDETSNKIAGWVVWASRGLSDSIAPPSTSKAETYNGVKIEEKLRALNPDDFKNASPSARDNLEKYTSTHFQLWMEKTMPPGTKCMFVVSIVVHPDYQKRGVGSLLARQGTERADREGVFCWVHSSEGAAGFYGREGFVVDERLELDLDEWNVEKVAPAEGQGRAWGKYTLQYMRRKPNAANGR